MRLGSLARQPSLDRAFAAAVLLLLVLSPLVALTTLGAHRLGRRPASESGLEGWVPSAETAGWTLAPAALALSPLLVRPTKRGRGQIISSILAAAAEGESSKTRLMYKSALDSRELKKYMALLTDTGLLLRRKSDGNRESYYLTDKGREFLQRYVELEKFLARP